MAKKSTTSEQKAIEKRCQRLIQLGHRPPDDSFEPELREALGDEHWRVRSAAARTLVRLGVKRQLAAGTLHALLDIAYRDEVTWSWHAATWTLCELARHRTPIRAALAEHPPEHWTVHALELAIRLPPETVPPDQLLPVLGHEDWRVRAAAATALGVQTRGADRERVADALGPCLEDDDPGVRSAAAKGLGKLGGRRALKALIGLFTDPDPAVQAMSLRALGDALAATEDEDGDADAAPGEEQLREVREVLESALSSRHGRVRHAAAALTAHMGRHARPMMGALIDALGDTDRAVADNIGYALVDVARGDPEAGPMLWRAVEHQRASVRVRALELVGQVAPVFPNHHSRTERVAQLVLTGLRGRSYESAVWLMRQIPLDHAPTLDVIRESLTASSVKARWRALALLQRSSKAARAFMPLLRNALHDPSTPVRLHATQLIPTLGRHARPALPEFVRRAFESDRTISHMARHGLADILADGKFPELLHSWLASMGKGTQASEFLDARVRRDGLPGAVRDEFIMASRAHAAWHGHVADIRAHKYQRTYVANATPAADAALIEQIEHAVAMATISATIKLPGQRSEAEVAALATRREYSWHIGRLLDLLNRHDGGESVITD